MSQFDEFLKEVEGLAEKEIKVLVVTGKPAAVRARSCAKQQKQRGGIILIPVCSLRKIS